MYLYFQNILESWDQVWVKGCGFKDEDVSQLTEVSTDLSINVSVEVSLTVAPNEISVSTSSIARFYYLKYLPIFQITIN